MWNGFSNFSSTYSLCGFQHLEPIEFVNGVAMFLPSFKLNDPKVMNEFPSLSKSMVQTLLLKSWIQICSSIGIKNLILYCDHFER